MGSMKTNKTVPRSIAIAEALELDIEFNDDFLLTIWPEGDVVLSKMENPANPRWQFIAEGKIVGDLKDIQWTTPGFRMPSHMHTSIVQALRSALLIPVGQLWVEQVWRRPQGKPEFFARLVWRLRSLFGR
jgi:hypothetical protein